MEDVLQKSINTLNGVMYKDAKRRILQFFGGQSIWGEDVINRVDTSNLVEAIKTELNIIQVAKTRINFTKTAIFSSR